MIIPGFPTPLIGKPGSAFPAVTINRAAMEYSPGLFFYGYIRPGGVMAPLFGVSGGSLSDSLVPGFITDAVMDNSEQLQIVIQGNAESILAGFTHFIDNGVPEPLNSPFAYDSDGNLTYAAISSIWSSTGTRTIQLASM